MAIDAERRRQQAEELYESMRDRMKFPEKIQKLNVGGK